MTPPQNNRPLAGVFWMLLTGFLFVGVTILVKMNGTHLPAAQSGFIRYLIGVVLLLPLFAQMRNTKITPRQWKMFTARGFTHAFGIIGWFFAMTQIPVAEVTALGYMSPIFVTLGAFLFLGERLAARRLIAVGLALLGALIILRPGFREIGPGHLAMMLTAVFFAGSYLLGKQLTDETSPAVMVLMLSIFVPIGLSPMALYGWVTPTGPELLTLTGVAVLATTGHYTMSKAFQAAPITVTQPASFLQLVWAILLGALLFDEPADVWVVLGGVCIMGSVVFISWREATLKRKQRATAATNRQ